MFSLDVILTVSFLHDYCCQHPADSESLTPKAMVPAANGVA